MNFNANQYREMYAKMGLDIDKLGCIMLDIDNRGMKAIPPLTEFFPKDTWYHTWRPERFWIKGFVAGEVPHITLLYGLISPLYDRADIDTVLNGWKPENVTISEIGYFDSPYIDEEYYCIVAHVRITDNLLEAHQRLSLLPHINTFPGYQAHLTIGYIKKDEKLRDEVMNFYDLILNPFQKSKTVSLESRVELKVIGINYGKDQKALTFNTEVE